MADELYKIEGWIPAMVAADTGEGGLVSLIGAKVFEGQAPQQTATFNPFPCLLFALLDGRVPKTMNGTQVMAAPLYKLVIADEDDFDATAYAALNRLFAVFGKVDTNAFEDNIFNCRLEDLFTSDFNDPRTVRRHKEKGGLFRIESYPAT